MPSLEIAEFMRPSEENQTSEIHIVVKYTSNTFEFEQLNDAFSIFAVLIVNQNLVLPFSIKELYQI